MIALHHAVAAEKDFARFAGLHFRAVAADNLSLESPRQAGRADLILARRQGIREDISGFG